MKKIFILLGIISITLLLGCESDWYPIYEDWLCTINIDGSDLEYIRNSFGNFLLSPDRQTLIEYTKNKFYSVSLNDLSSRTLLVDYGDDLSAIHKPALSNNSIVYFYHGDIYIYDISDADTNRIVSSMYPTLYKSLTISNDGTKVAYSTKNDSLSSIILINSDGSERNAIYKIENINLSKYYLKNPRFVDNDEEIVFSIYGNQYCTISDGIYSVNVEGNDFHCIVEDNYTDYITVSTDKDYILYIFDGQIHLVGLNEIIDYILDDTYNEFFFPSFSPNGQKILYAKEDYPYIINSNGTNKYKLTDKLIGYTSPYYKESYFLDENKIIISLKKQIN